MGRASSVNATGLAVYFVSSYLGHSCTPNAQIVFNYPKSKQMKPKAQLAPGSPTLVLKALKEIAEGEELVVSYIPSTVTDVAERNRLLSNWQMTSTLPQEQQHLQQQEEQVGK